MRRIAYLLASVLLVIQTAGGVELLMSTRESIAFAEDLTLEVMDVDPGAGVVWLELRDDGGLLKSSVMGTGESFAYDERGDGLNLTVTRIYAGGERDLVDLELVSGEVVESTGSSAPDDSGQGLPVVVDGDSSLANWGLVALLVLLLAAWVCFGSRPGRR